MDAMRSFTGNADGLCLKGVATFDLASSDEAMPYRIFVSVPEGDVPPAGFPIIYVLDGNADFVTVSETVRRVTRRPAATGIRPAIVVGIGYPDTVDYHTQRRYFDFTRQGPDGDHVEAASSGGAAKGAIEIAGAYGGQVAFIEFLTQRLVPKIEARYAADPAQRMLIGHSLAGYFVMEMAARCPGFFSGHAAFSPSLWWDFDGLKGRLANADQKKGAQQTGRSRFYLAAGRYEQDLAPWQAAHASKEGYLAVRENRRMVDNARDLAGALTALDVDGGEFIRFELGEEEDHATILPAFLCRGLRFIQAR